MVADRPERDLPLTATDYLAAILGELTTIRRQLVQEPQVRAGDAPLLVTEPDPGAGQQ